MRSGELFETEAVNPELNSNAAYFCFAVKKTRAMAKQNRSTYVLERDDGTFVQELVVEHNRYKRYPSGGFSRKVKKAYNDLITDLPSYAIKTFHFESSANKPSRSLLIAMNSGYFSRLLSRTGQVFYFNNEAHLVTDWYQGKTLAWLWLSEDSDYLRDIPFLKRLQFAIDITSQLAVLHSCGVVHGDVKPDNVIFPEEGAAQLIDLDGAHLCGERLSFAMIGTHQLLSNKKFEEISSRSGSFQVDFPCDVRALALTFAFIFPDLFKIRKPYRPGSGKRYFYYKQKMRENSDEYKKHGDLANYINLLLDEGNPNPPESANVVLSELLDLAKRVYNKEMLVCVQPLNGVDAAQIRQALLAIEQESRELDLRFKRYSLLARQFQVDIHLPGFRMLMYRHTVNHYEFVAGLPLSASKEIFSCIERSVISYEDRWDANLFYVNILMRLAPQSRMEFFLFNCDVMDNINAAEIEPLFIGKEEKLFFQARQQLLALLNEYLTSTIKLQHNRVMQMRNRIRYAVTINEFWPIIQSYGLPGAPINKVSEGEPFFKSAPLYLFISVGYKTMIEKCKLVMAKIFDPGITVEISDPIVMAAEELRRDGWEIIPRK